MKPVWLPMSVWIVALLAAPVCADPSFTLNAEAAQMLQAVAHSPTGGFIPTQLFGVTTNPWEYNGTGLMQGQIGYVGLLSAQNPRTDPFAWIKIGAGAGVGSVLAAALGSGSTTNLGGYDSFHLFLANDGADLWQVKLYLSTSGDARETGWTTLAPGANATLMMSLAGMANLNNVTDVGFLVGARLDQTGGNPGNPAIFHISAVPVPGTVILGLLGLGAAGLKLRKDAYGSPDSAGDN